MKHFSLAIVGLLLALAPAWAQTADEKTATLNYLQLLQQPDGSFQGGIQPDIYVPPSLRTTSSALRALKYFGGGPKDRAAAAKFIESCYDKETGGFREHPGTKDKPGPKPDVFTTAVGIMAALEAKVPPELFTEGTVKFLAENTKSFEDIRIAVAGLERINKPSPKADEWRKQVNALLNADGTAGKGDGAARETGSVIVALLRLGDKEVKADKVLSVLKAGQRADGGYGKAEVKGSDLETSYRVMRAFVMLKSKPDSPDKLRDFVAKCRNADGGYGSAPGQGSTVSGTYFAAIILHWLEQK